MVATYTVRVQAMLSEEQHSVLLECAQRAQKPVGVLVREAVQQVHLQQAEQARRQEALDRMLALNAPVGEWEEMEDEIIRAATDGG